MDYVNKWFRLERFPTKINWISLASKEVAHEDVLELAGQIAPELEDSLFDEVTTLNGILQEIPDEQLEGLSAAKKWQRIFKADLPTLRKLVSKIMSVFVSNAYIERVFSLIGNQWTDARNLLKMESVKSIAQVKVNFDHSCPEMYQMILSSQKLLKEIMSVEKYHI